MLPTESIQSPARFNQRKFGSETQFDFDLDNLKYRVSDKSGSNTFNTPYAEIGRERDLLVERNTWLQNVGYLWLALGAVLTGISYFGSGALRPSLWLFVGAGCVGVAWLRTIRYTKLVGDRGTVFIMQDRQHDAILAQIEARRVDQLRRWYDFFDADEDAGRQRNRFEWLRRQDALDDAELAQRLQKLEGMTRLPQLPGEFVAADDDPPGRTLN